MNANASSAGRRNTKSITSHAGSVRIWSVRPCGQGSMSVPGECGYLVLLDDDAAVPVIISAWGRRGWRAPRLSSRPRERQGARLKVAHEEADDQEGPIPVHGLRASQYLAADARAKRPVTSGIFSIPAARITGVVSRNENPAEVGSGCRLVSGTCSSAEEIDLQGGGGGNPAAVNRSVGMQVRLHDRDVDRAFRSSSVQPLYGRCAAGLKSIVPVSY
jgi:hypothetical protein